jgi:hypothetical protein
LTKKSSDTRVERKRGGERPVFEAMRKPVAPPGHALGQAKPEERAHPAERKVKHKHRAGDTEE